MSKNPNMKNSLFFLFNVAIAQTTVTENKFRLRMQLCSDNSTANGIVPEATGKKECE